RLVTSLLHRSMGGIDAIHEGVLPSLLVLLDMMSGDTSPRHWVSLPVANHLRRSVTRFVLPPRFWIFNAEQPDDCFVIGVPALTDKAIDNEAVALALSKQARNVTPFKKDVVNGVAAIKALSLR